MGEYSNVEIIHVGHSHYHLVKMKTIWPKIPTFPLSLHGEFQPTPLHVHHEIKVSSCLLAREHR
jgi:hypothetical protein